MLGVLAATAAGAAGLPALPYGVVRLSSSADLLAVCAALEERPGDAAHTAYLLKLDSTAFALGRYDEARGRIAVDVTRGFAADDGSWQLVPSWAAAPEGAMDISLAAAPREAARLRDQHRAEELELVLWFRMLEPPDQGACARGQRRVRIPIQPLAYALLWDGDVVARGEAPGYPTPAPGGPAWEEPRFPRAPEVRVALPVFAGTVEPAVPKVALVAPAVAPRLQSCYEMALVLEPDLAGSMLVHATVDPEGKVVAARAHEDRIGMAEVTTCVLETFARTAFPRKHPGRYAFHVTFAAE